MPGGKQVRQTATLLPLRALSLLQNSYRSLAFTQFLQFHLLLISVILYLLHRILQAKFWDLFILYQIIKSLQRQLYLLPFPLTPLITRHLPKRLLTLIFIILVSYHHFPLQFPLPPPFP